MHLFVLQILTHCYFFYFVMNLEIIDLWNPLIVILLIFYKFINWIGESFGNVHCRINMSLNIY